jgi:hypothetical protein
MNYEEIRSSLNTGDIVLCNGKGFVSDLIGWFTGSKMSHIGLIVRTSYEVQLLHCGWTKAVKGVQLTPFGEYVRNYKGEIYVRSLVCNRDRDWFAVLHDFICKHRSTSYEKGIGGLLELLGAALQINRQNELNLFCSEMVAELFKLWGYLPADVPSNNYVPADFEYGGKLDACLRMASEVMGQYIKLEGMRRITK